MKQFVTTAATLLLAAGAVADKRDLCSEGTTDDNGNWYCQAVDAITYSGVGSSGSYNKITAMSGSGSCSSSPQGYSGTLAPFDEEVSLHFRGPVQLKQLAVYTPGGSSSKARRDSPHQRRQQHAEMHAHNAMHHREAEPAPAPAPAVGDEVVATIDGQVVSWVNEYSGQAASAVAAVNNVKATPASSPAQATGAASNSGSSSSTSSSSSSSSNSGSATGAWTRQSYYNSESGTSDGLVFLNHNGGSGSGVFDYTYGNSLSYASTDGTAGASSPQTLADTTLPSSAEVIVFSDQQCSDSDCGFVRPGTVAYHGFEGANKVFLMEFGMPDSGESSASIYDPVNMPAIWMLNAQIPRTLQYGQADCSCWTSGCGEFDIFEVLAPGDSRCKSTIHGNMQGGDSDFFDRPTTGTMKAAIVMNNDNFHIKILNSSASFDPSLDSSFVNAIGESTSVQNTLVSLFELSS